MQIPTEYLATAVNMIWIFSLQSTAGFNRDQINTKRLVL